MKVIGKGAIEREVFLSGKTKIDLQKYLLSRGDTNESLFVAGKTPYNRLGKRAIQKELKVVATNA